MVYAALLMKAISALLDSCPAYRLLERHMKVASAVISSLIRRIRPELLATAANQLWSWDIIKLRGPVKWTCLSSMSSLTFSRFVVAG